MKHQFPALFMIGNHSYRTKYILVFQKSGVRRALRVYQSVHAEIAIMDRFSMITAIMIYGLPIFCPAMCDRMIAPFPDKSSADPVITLDHLKVIFKISRSISHAVAILDKQERFAAILLQIFADLFQRRIHPAVQIQILIIILDIIIAVSGALVLCDPVRIKFLCPFQRFFKIAAVGALISHRPHNDTATVFVPLYHKLYTVYDRLLPHWVVSNFFIPAMKPVPVGIFPAI